MDSRPGALLPREALCYRLQPPRRARTGRQDVSVMGLFLGLDSSTQSLSALVVDTDRGAVVLDESVNFGKTLPEYGSPHGFIPNADARIKHADPVMWVAALDVLFGRVKAGGFDLGSIAGVSGAGQQHGSVYLRRALTN